LSSWRAFIGLGAQRVTAGVAGCLLVAGLAGGGAALASGGGDGQVAIVIGGDLGLGGSDQPISERGGVRHGRTIPWAELTTPIAPLLDGEINFANLETVVTDRSRLAARDKAFNFRMHPAGVRQLVKAGFNVFSTANNHAIDYGQAGMHETYKHLSALKREGLLAFPGIGRGRESLLEPAIVDATPGSRVAILAMGIGGASVGPGATHFGQLGYSGARDFGDGVAALAAAKADYRILSLHYGQELQISPSAGDVAKLRDKAAGDGAIDLVVGHHAHVAAGVQRMGKKLIFYGLGNLLHLGMQDMAKFGPCRDFGLLGRVLLVRSDDGRLEARAIQVIPLTRMHEVARAMTGAAAVKRIGVLNGLARGLDSTAAGAAGVRFRPQADGSGLYCMDGAKAMGGRIGKLCKDWSSQGDYADRSIYPVHQCGARVVANRRRIDQQRRKANQRTTGSGKSQRSFVNNFYARTYGR
jgi:hypothetical protein